MDEVRARYSGRFRAAVPFGGDQAWFNALGRALGVAGDLALVGLGPGSHQIISWGSETCSRSRVMTGIAGFLMEAWAQREWRVDSRRASPVAGAVDADVGRRLPPEQDVKNAAAGARLAISQYGGDAVRRGTGIGGRGGLGVRITPASCEELLELAVKARAKLDKLACTTDTAATFLLWPR